LIALRDHIAVITANWALWQTLPYNASFELSFLEEDFTLFGSGFPEPVELEC
jgi:hypothetical protein